LERAFLFQFCLFLFGKLEDLHVGVLHMHGSVFELFHEVHFLEEVAVFEDDFKRLQHDLLTGEVGRQHFNHAVEVLFSFVVLRAVDCFERSHACAEDLLDFCKELGHFLLVVFELLLGK
jgi:hypothetical protein